MKETILPIIQQWRSEIVRLKYPFALTIDKKETRNGMDIEIRSYRWDDIEYFTSVSYDEKWKMTQIYNKDRTDRNNEPCIMSRSIRWLKKVAEEIYKFDQVVSQRYVRDLFNKHNIKVHSYCAVD